MFKKIAQLALCAAVGGSACWGYPPACRIGAYWKDQRQWKILASS